MNPLKTHEIAKKYLEFFEERGCTVFPSSSLIPDDPSLLLTSAGMVQFKPYFLGTKNLDSVGAASCQKCVRTTDIDVIGTTGRHLSFFEMLGNFSFGGYFKKEACTWAYEFSTQVLGFDPDRLYFTVYLDDDETIEIWKSLGVPESHISRLGADDNFWTAGPTGPCGPCSELYFDQGPEVGCGSADCAPGCDCDRFLEFWNLVFTQYDRQEDGTLVPLPRKNIDTGMGLERVAAILQGKNTNYETDALRGLVALAEKLSGKTYHDDPRAYKEDLSLRILADHARSVSFMIADGVLPSNEGRGYVLRRLLRHAIRHGHLIGIEGAFFTKFVDAVIEQMGDRYPELVDNRVLLLKIVASEEERFNATLAHGSAYLDDALAALEPGATLSGKEAFVLHDTFGFPIELTREICEEQGHGCDMEGFQAEMTIQKERARAAVKDDSWSTYGGVFSKIITRLGKNEFVGYTQNEADAKILALVVNGEEASKISAGQEAEIVLDVTPFYAEMGGQVGDTGWVTSADGAKFVVESTSAPEKGLSVVKGHVEAGSFAVDAKVTATIDVNRRERIRRNHTATHLLHSALREVLGDHVKQAGSMVAQNRLRFDFTHFSAMTAEEIAQVEAIVNEHIMANTQVANYETSLTEARAAGVTALFGEKYGDVVRVVDAGEFSRELCGGTHARTTGEIGLFKVISEASVGANVRRIEAVTSYDALSYYVNADAQLNKAAELLKVKPAEVVSKTEANLVKLKEAEAAIKEAKKSEKHDFSQLLDAAVEKDGYKIVIARVEDLFGLGIREYWDALHEAGGEKLACFLAAIPAPDKPLLLAAATAPAVEAGFNAGALIKATAEAIGGRGGGKPAMAQAGGTNVAGIDDALARAKAELGI